MRDSLLSLQFSFKMSFFSLLLLFFFFLGGRGGVEAVNMVESEDFDINL